MTASPLKTVRRSRAFTMVEVLLAIAIFSMVLAAIYSCWSAIMRGSARGLAAAAEVQRTRVAIRALEESLGSAVMYADNPMYYSFFAVTSGDFASLSFVARLSESFPGSGLFPGYPLRRVEFAVDEQQNLLLKQSTVLDAGPALDPNSQPYTITLAPKVGLFAIEFYDQRMNEWVPEWVSTNTLPKMVRVAIGFGEKGQYTSPSTEMTLRMIPLNATPITRAGGGVAGGALPGGNPNVQPGGGGVRNPGDNPRDRRRPERGERADRGGGGGRGMNNPGMGAGMGGFGGGAGLDDGPRFMPRTPTGFTPPLPGGGSPTMTRNPIFPPMPGR